MARSDEDIAQELLGMDDEFRRFYEKHRLLKQQVHDANVGTLPVDDVSLENLKKEKLLLKDRMAVKIKAHRGV